MCGSVRPLSKSTARIICNQMTESRPAVLQCSMLDGNCDEPHSVYTEGPSNHANHFV